jgi:hypothetical protein
MKTDGISKLLQENKQQRPRAEGDKEELQGRAAPSSGHRNLNFFPTTIPLSAAQTLSGYRIELIMFRVDDDNLRITQFKRDS